MNIPDFVRSTGVGRLTNRFKGCPAIVVAAGPSLNKNIDLLRDFQDNALIISVDTSYQTLREHGIRPHIVTAIDPSAVSIKHFNRTDSVSDSIFGFDPECCCDVQRKFVGRKFALGAHGIKLLEWLEQHTRPIGFLQKGNTVAHTSFYLARQLGCDPIVFVGLDLALPPGDGPTHVSGASLGGRYRVDPQDRNYVIISHPHNPELFERRRVFWVEGALGGEVPTLEILYNYLRKFEIEFALTTQKIIDATEGGCLKRGAEVMTLAEVYQKYCQTPLNVDGLLDDCFLPPLSASIEKSLGEELRKGQLELEESHQIAERGYSQISALEESILAKRIDPQQVKWELNEIQKFINELSGKSLTQFLLQRCMAGVHFLFMANTKTSPGRETPQASVLENVRRRKMLFDAIRIYAADAAEILGPVIERLEKGT